MPRSGQVTAIVELIERVANPFVSRIHREKNRFIRENVAHWNRTGFFSTEIHASHRQKMQELYRYYGKRVITLSGRHTFAGLKNGRVWLETKDDDARQSFFVMLLQQWLSRHGLEKSRLAADTTLDDLRAALAEGVRELEPSEAIAKRLLAVRKLSRFRARTIAITETHSAAAFARSESAKRIMQDFEEPLWKKWNAVDDERTRPAHNEVDDVTIPMDDFFIVGGERMERPHDFNASSHNTIRCRCVETYVDPPENP